MLFCQKNKLIFFVSKIIITLIPNYLSLLVIILSFASKVATKWRKEYNKKMSSNNKHGTRFSPRGCRLWHGALRKLS